ncbi:unnamed protein product [Lactuca saligna]|uniref:J domain-containing protein n=1 Tax=Lactuca saligna TaxID=75948 RepID=A0AA35YXH7_LACSI|nr:unnamed protein product [Lactuca saligna]
MERVGRSEHVSMRFGHSQRSFENGASSSDMAHVKNHDNDNDNDVDFDDVFGGPPTRTRYSFGGGRIKSSEESTSSPSGLGERPVFGESYSSPRRPTSDDFYNDIFRSSSESVRSPRWSSPTPGSRSLSPTHPKIEPFANSIPTEFSLPPRMNKAVDIPVFGSNPHSSTTILSRFSSPTTKGRDVFGNNQEQQSTEKETGHKSNPRTARTGSPTLSMETMQDSSFQNDKLSTEKEDINPPSATLMESIEKETSIMKQQVNETKEQGYEEAASIDVEKKETISGVIGKKKVEVKKMNKSVIGSPKNRVKGMVKDFFKISNQEKSPPKTKTNVVHGSLSSRWKTTAKTRTHEEVSGNQENVEMAKNASNKTFDSEIPEDIMKMVPDDDDDDDDVASTTIPLDNKAPKENIKIKIIPDASSTTKNEKIVPDVSRTTSLDTKMSSENVKMAPDASFMVGGKIKKSNKPKFPQNRPIRKLEDIYFQKEASPAFESVPRVSKVNIENTDDPSLDNFHVEELPSVEDEVLKKQEESLDTKGLDSKIHHWSSGRKGNIRSLLSTLQLVLWADSGWKPVALVDIIEANAVKKAYNRAMLCLHPDKLQQKGADSNKKYMAEKVFDILQEAWDHFNSLGTLI